MGLAFTRRGQSNRVERHGKVFQSLTEADFYSALLNVRTPFEWQAEFVLQEGVPKNPKILLLSGAGVHKIKCTVDFLFWTPNETRCIVDTKGSKKYATERSVMAYHLLKGMVFRSGSLSLPPDKTKILMIDRKEVTTLLKLSLSADKTAFWTFFNKLTPF